MLSVRNLTKIYKLKGKDVKEVRALDGVSLDFPETGLVFLLGKSGSGKSTLLNTIGGLDSFNSGEVIIKGKSSKHFKQSDFDAYRNTFIGFIFQEYNILDEFSVGKNLALALELQGKKAGKAQVDALLDQVDLHGYYKRKPNQLSGGQKQRVAIARALIKDPQIIMADEPTGALDSNTGRQVMDTLKKLSKSKLVIIVSHDREFAEIYGDRVVELKDGKVIRDVTKTEIEAQKGGNGVSYIDDKIIHIKKGSKLTKSDLLEINKRIIENASKEDTFVSFDKKPNDELKRTAFITDEGNREVFKDTTANDIKLQQYDPKHFKLIRSKLKVKDAFKMGTSSLKTKPIRLIFTILLSFIAFAMFGVVDTMASFNRATATYESSQMLGNKTLSFTKQFNEGENSTADRGITDEDLNKLQNANHNYNFYKIIWTGASYNVRNAGEYTSTSNSGNNYLSVDYIGGILNYDETILNNLNVLLEAGRAPSADDEIVIPNLIFSNIKKNYSEIENLQDLTSRNATISINNKEFKIVGVANPQTDLTKYTQNNSTTGVASYMLYSEVNTILSYGTTNLCYVSSNTYESALSEYRVGQLGYSRGNQQFYYYYKKTDYSQSISFSEIRTYSSAYADMLRHNNDYSNFFNWTDQWGNEHYDEWANSEEYLIANGATNISHSREMPVFPAYTKPGVTISALQEKQLILRKDMAMRIAGAENDAELEASINAGLKVKIYQTYNSKSYIEFDLVGYHQYNNYYIVSDTMRDKLCGRYDYVLTGSKGSADKALINNLMENDSALTNFKLQFQATSSLDSFGNMIESMSKVFLYVGIALAVFAGFMLMNFIATSISYKKHEIGILRAIGAGKKDVFSIFFSESFVIAMINFILAGIGTFVACFFINRGLYQELGFSITLLSFGIRQVVLLLAVSIGVAFISTFLPVFKIAKKNPIDSINGR